jgi:hypothetical protein
MACGRFAYLGHAHMIATKRDRIALRLSELAKLLEKTPPHPIVSEVHDELLRLAGTPG